MRNLFGDFLEYVKGILFFLKFVLGVVIWYQALKFVTLIAPEWEPLKIGYWVVMFLVFSYPVFRAFEWVLCAKGDLYADVIAEGHRRGRIEAAHDRERAKARSGRNRENRRVYGDPL